MPHIINKIKEIKHIKGQVYLYLCTCGKTFKNNRGEAKKRATCAKCKVGIEPKFYQTWKGINGRCYCKTNSAYKNYGAVGIESDWKYDFNIFKKDMYVSFKKHYKAHGIRNTTIDRIDASKGYSKENCRWATIQQQSDNKDRTLFIIYKNKSYSITELGKRLNIKKETLRQRISNGWSEDILSLRPRIGNNQSIRNIELKWK